MTRRLRQAGQTCIPAGEAFDLFETYGLPLSLTVELAGEQGLRVDEAGFEALYEAHKDASRQVTAQKFKGGLADNAEQTTRLHTATHLLHQALRMVLGTGVQQKGSNITAERLRFDFSYPERLTEAQIEAVERIVNDQIGRDLPVSLETMPLEQALQAGALAFFGEKYGEHGQGVYHRRLLQRSVRRPACQPYRRAGPLSDRQARIGGAGRAPHPRRTGVIRFSYHKGHVVAHRFFPLSYLWVLRG